MNDHYDKYAETEIRMQEAAEKKQKKNKPSREAELEYLQWVKANADFGPADSEVHDILNEQYERETGNKVPEEWK